MYGLRSWFGAFNKVAGPSEMGKRSTRIKIRHGDKMAVRIIGYFFGPKSPSWRANRRSISSSLCLYSMHRSTYGWRNRHHCQANRKSTVNGISFFSATNVKIRSGFKLDGCAITIDTILGPSSNHISIQLSVPLNIIIIKFLMMFPGTDCQQEWKNEIP